MVIIKDLDKADVLRDLYNNSKVQGFGFLHATGKPMTTEEARELLKHQTYFDYLHGKVMKVDLSMDSEFDERLYDRDNGTGAAQYVVNRLRESQHDANSPRTATYEP